MFHSWKNWGKGPSVFCDSDKEFWLRKNSKNFFFFFCQVKFINLIISALRTFSHVKNGKKYQGQVRRKRAEGVEKGGYIEMMGAGRNERGVQQE